MEDTIAAIATAYGEGGIGIIRISGSESLSILNKIFVPFKKLEIESRRMTYGTVKDPADGSIIEKDTTVKIVGINSTILEVKPADLS